MTYDPKLIEAVAQALWAHDHSDSWHDYGAFEHADYLACAKDCLAAIEASRIAWVAPWELPQSIIDWYAHGLAAIDYEWRQIRDACLAERLGEASTS